jgi:hypothetical protein
MSSKLLRYNITLAILQSFKIRSFFCEKWLLFHDLAGFIDIKMYASIHFMSISPLDIKISYTAV